MLSLTRFVMISELGGHVELISREVLLQNC